MTGIEMIAQERKRQVEVEGYDANHDITCHADNELALAAACYAVNGLSGVQVQEYGEDAFPFADEYDRRSKHGRLRSLVVAGALCAAEVDRLIAEDGSDAA